MDATHRARARLDGRSYFRPALFWQEIQAGQLCDGGLEFNMGMGEEGVNKARLPCGDFDLESGGPERLAAAVAAHTVVVPESEARDDSETVSKMLTTSATWGDAAEVGKLLRCCYITQQAALPALAGAASFGYVEVVQVLLQAGCSPSAVVPGRPGGKNALHVAAEAGQEDAAAVLVEAMKTRAEFEAVDGGGRTAAALLRQADMGGICRRLEAKAAQHFSSSSHGSGSKGSGSSDVGGGGGGGGEVSN